MILSLVSLSQRSCGFMHGAPKPLTMRGCSLVPWVGRVVQGETGFDVDRFDDEGLDLEIWIQTALDNFFGAFLDECAETAPGGPAYVQVARRPESESGRDMDDKLVYSPTEVISGHVIP